MARRAVLPPLITAYTQAAEQQRAILEVVFSASVNFVYLGLWNILEELVAGVGWIGIGLFLREERPAIGTVTVILGISALVDSVGTILLLETIAVLGLNVYLVLAPVWALWLGIDLLRRPVQIGG